MPLYRRLPKRGFNNPFTKDYAELTLGNLEAAVAKGKIDAKKPVTEEVLRASGMVKKGRHGVRLQHVKPHGALYMTAARDAAFSQQICDALGKSAPDVFLYCMQPSETRKVAQAAGRVIRTPEDRGVIWLIDDRFLQPQIRNLLPAWWA